MTAPKPPPPSPPANPPRRVPARAQLELETDIEVYVGSGPGGQHRNKTESAVRLTHRPTGVVVTATERRSQHQNRAVAFERLIEKLEDLFRPRAPRVPTKVSKAAKRRRVADKRVQGERKQQRKRVDGKDD